MLDQLTAQFDEILKRIRGEGRLTEENIKASMSEIRDILLDADVNFKVVKTFIAKVERKAVGQKVLRSVRPGQQVVQIVHDELKSLLGHNAVPLKNAGIPPTIILLCGLQGSGKTTFAGKLALKLKNAGQKPMLAGADVYRPAAREQLKTLAEQADVPVYTDDRDDAVGIVKEAVDAARKRSCDTLIVDTAGRLAIDSELMDELRRIKKAVKPHEILFVGDSMLGQDAVNTAKSFLNDITYDGIVLTKMDGDARGGAALSIKAVTGKPIKFIGTGEKLTDIEAFHPDRVASRILGKGDVLTFVEKAQAAVDEKESKKLAQKMLKNTFTLQDFLDQIRQIKKMGPIEDLLKMIPGMGAQMKQLPVDQKAFVRTEAIINSMTKDERMKPGLLTGSRRRRIAAGSGTQVQDVNQVINQFDQMKKMMKKMGKKAFPSMGGPSPLSIGR